MKKYIGEPVYLNLVGKKELTGVLIDYGSDVLVLLSQNDFYYIPLFHIREIRSLSKEEAGSFSQSDTAMTLSFDEQLSLKEVLHAAAKGSFVEVNITAAHAIHGYITNVLDDYLVLFTPIYETILIPIHHIKFLIPYSKDSRPYGFKLTKAPVSVIKAPPSAFEDHLAKLKGSFITLNIEGKDSISGQLIGKEAEFIELLTVREQQIHLNIHHIKTVMPFVFKEEKQQL
ncbi:hypothetical protein [Domibacillus tundrae]|uniref:hypothetical protein n=1 Tax=Domibacillus tundrae TaxID=1587527 RepID=UPI003390E017